MNQKGINLLPKGVVPITLRCGHRDWSGTYNGTLVRPVISKDVWQSFVDDNMLADRDVCTFDILQISETRGVIINVICMKGPFETPEELEAARLAGTSAEHAIVVDYEIKISMLF